MPLIVRNESRDRWLNGSGFTSCTPLATGVGKGRRQEEQKGGKGGQRVLNAPKILSKIFWFWFEKKRKKIGNQILS